MRLIIIIGPIATGKTIALRALEKQGYHCIDSLPVDLLLAFLKQTSNKQNTAISIDSLSLSNNSFEQLKQAQYDYPATYFIAFTTSKATLEQRLQQTSHKNRFPHSKDIMSDQFITQEHFVRQLLDWVDLHIDTTDLNDLQLNELVNQRIAQEISMPLSIHIQSFGYKHGIPTDCNYIFDVRCLANPYWQAELREYSGKDTNVIAFLNQQPLANQLLIQLSDFISTWAPIFEKNNYQQLKIGIGCTGGQHRSVYIAEQLSQQLCQKLEQETVLSHRDIP